MKVSGTASYTIHGYKCVADYSFTIKLTSEGYGDITDLEIKNKGTSMYYSDDYNMAWSISAKNIAQNSFKAYTDYDFLDFDSNEGNGLTIGSFSMKYDVESYYPAEQVTKKETTSLSYKKDPTNRVSVQLRTGD